MPLASQEINPLADFASRLQALRDDARSSYASEVAQWVGGCDAHGDQEAVLERAWRRG